MAADAKWAFAKEFATQFQSSQTDLETRLAAAKTNPSKDLLDELAVDLAKATKELAEATGSLPNHDQRAYEMQLKALEKALDDLRSSSTSKPRFSFKRKAGAVSSKPAQPKPNSPATAEPKPEPVTTDVPSTRWTISNRTGEYLNFDSLPSSEEAPGSDLSIADLDSCVVNLVSASSQPFEISALHIRNIKNTILMLPVIKGSVLLHDLKGCIVVVGAHQFRMHTSQAVDVYISIQSSPIIEHCKQTRFTSYPSKLSETSTAGHTSVQDFSHIKSSPSPNWSILPIEDCIADWPIDSTDQVQRIVQRLCPALP
ncbi:tubulin binding cofactor C-domain-containing protein [Mycena floridula]|nr:tubulin binding cofactor C-domain-containing protein [Mycena floridula]